MMIEETQTDQKSTLKKKLQLSIEKNIRTWLKRITLAVSITNGSISTIVNLVNLISRPVIATSILLGNTSISIAFNLVSFTLNTYSLANHFRERNILKKFNVERSTEEKKRDKNKLQVICLDLVCDMLFLTGAITSIALFGSSIALTATITFLVLGGLVLFGSIAKSTISQVQEFKNHLLKQEGKGKKELYQEEIKSSLLYRVMAKVLPDSIVLAKWHYQQKEKSAKKVIAELKQNRKTDSITENKPSETEVTNKIELTNEQDSQGAKSPEGPNNTHDEETLQVEPNGKTTPKEPDGAPKELASVTIQGKQMLTEQI